MDFWAWWAGVEPRTDWIAIIVGFFATLASTVIAVMIALRLQRNDFDKRAREAADRNAADADQRRVDLDTRRRELAEQSDADARSRRNDWRRSIVAKAFDVLNDAEDFAMDPSSAKGNQRSASIDALMMEFSARRRARRRLRGSVVQARRL